MNVDLQSGVALLTQMCAAGNLDVVDTLLVRGADVNGGVDRTPQMVCCEAGSMVIVKRLLTHLSPPHINLKNEQGRTALQMAISSSHSTVVMFLLSENTFMSFKGLSFNEICSTKSLELMKKFLVISTR